MLELKKKLWKWNFDYIRRVLLIQEQSVFNDVYANSRETIYCITTHCFRHSSCWFWWIWFVFSFVLCGVEKVWRNWKKQFVHLYAYYYVGSIKIVQNFVWKHQSHCRVKNGLHDVCDNKCFLRVIKCVH